MNLQLQTGKTIKMSSYEFFFVLPDDKVDEFYQSCIADDLGEFVENPFSGRAPIGRIEADDDSSFQEEELEETDISD